MIGRVPRQEVRAGVRKYDSEHQLLDGILIFGKPAKLLQSGVLFGLYLHTLEGFGVKYNETFVGDEEGEVVILYLCIV